MLIIGAAGFGRRIRWSDELIPPAGHRMSFKVRLISQFKSTFHDVLATVSDAALVKASLHGWILYLTKRGRTVLQAYNELEVRSLLSTIRVMDAQMALP